ncbi:MAG: TlyA family RNA methyltransferase [Verrucomicrobia bacterium]|nr:TlyA family RNA methyltransferase [Verrucomicrobiota bacterium]
MDGTQRDRIDKILVRRGFFQSREHAQRALMAGQVLVDERLVDKPGSLVRGDAEIRVTGAERFVGRGGYKLEAALDHFGISPAGWRCLDVGASTGGFTDCLLQRGARHVSALDVGYNQLSYRLRTDPRVSVYEGVNARYLTPDELGAPFELAVVDVSFISLTLVLPPIFACLALGGLVIALIKPQFELHPKKVGKGGIVREPGYRQEAVDKVHRFVTEGLGREWRGVIPSPIAGAKGNQEFLACLR